MEAACVERVTGRRFAGRAATLHGWMRTIASHGYPVIHPSPDDRVDGIVLDGLDTAALRALDAYEDEGRLYLRRQVTVLVGDEPIPCETYVGHSSRSRSRY
jgi:Gamma-glutamyl cyclotransferase, AIG2-like